MAAVLSHSVRESQPSGEGQFHTLVVHGGEESFVYLGHISYFALFDVYTITSCRFLTVTQERSYQ